MMTRSHFLGLGVGFCIAAIAINHGSPLFFTAKHVDNWRQDLASRGLLHGSIAEQEENVGSANLNVPPWGY
jgi:hypothetical protein